MSAPVAAAPDVTVGVGASLAPADGWRSTRTGRFLSQPGAVLSALFLLALVVVAAAGTAVTPYPPLHQDLNAVLKGPGGGHMLGTDSLGRDELSLLLYGARWSLEAIGVVLAVSLLGVPLGILSVSAGRQVRWLLTLFSDGILSFPPLVLAIGLVAVLGPGLSHAMMAVGFIFIPRFLRLTDQTVRRLWNEPYVRAARAIGTSRGQVVRWHIIPNAIGPLAVQLAVTAAYGLLAEAGLSFLGLGVQPPAISWGSMLGTALQYINRSTLDMVWPGLLIVLTVLSLNGVADGLRRAVGWVE